MPRSATNLFETGKGEENIHSLAIDLLKRNPDHHFLTFLELYRNAIVKSDVAQMMIDALLEADAKLSHPMKVMSGLYLSSTVKHLKAQL